MNRETVYRRFAGPVALISVAISLFAACGSARYIGDGHRIVGGLLLLIQAISGGMLIGQFRDWRRYRRMYANLQRQRAAAPLSYADLQQIYQGFALEAVAEFNAAGRIATRLLLVRLDPRRRERVLVAVAAPPAALVRLSHGDFYRNAQALAADFLSDQSPTRQSMAADGLPLPDLVALVDEARIAGARPESREAVAVFLYAREGLFMGCSPIHNAPTRRAVYDPELIIVNPAQPTADLQEPA